MRTDRPPTRHKDKTKTLVFDALLSLVYGRLEKPTYCEYAQMRVACVSPWKPLGVRTNASPMLIWAFWLGAKYGTHKCEHTVSEQPRDFGRKAGVRTVASPLKNP